MALSDTTYVTLGGLPVRIELQWPFHPSQSGADWFSLHGRISLDDGGPLHADVAVNLTQVIKEALPSLEPAEAEAVVVNALRKELDVKQLELLKSGKRQPVPVSSRHFDFKNSRLIFAKATDDEIRQLLLRRVLWTAIRHGEHSRAWMADPYDALYVNATTAHLLGLAQALANDGWIVLDGEHALPSARLLGDRERLEAETKSALSQLEAKHAFERA